MNGRRGDRRGRPPDQGPNGRLAVLSAAAIVAIYAVGYARTEGAAKQIAALAAGGAAAQSTATSGQSGAASSTAPPSTNPNAGVGEDGGRRRGGGQSTTTPPPASSSTANAGSGGSTGATSGYKNGSYTGVGYGSHGPVQVKVVIKSGRIVSANITACGTTYPCQYIQPLPPEVVARQSSQTDYVMGATASSLAYMSAVSNALAQAQ